MSESHVTVQAPYMRFRHVILMRLCCRSTGKLPLEIAFLWIRTQRVIDAIALLPVPPSGKNGQKPSMQWLKACRSKRRR